jgi:hypothetical protein
MSALSVGATGGDCWRPVFWEPVVGTGERFTIGALVRINNVVTAHQIMRDDVLDCMFGKAATGVRALLQEALALVRLVAEAGFEEADVPMEGFLVGQPRYTKPGSISEALKVCALMHSSLSAMDYFDESDEADTPLPEETSRRFSTEVRASTLARRPELARAFGRTAVLTVGGLPVKFGFLSEVAIVHFSVFQPIRQAQSVRDARARLFELGRAKTMSSVRSVALITAVPRSDEPTLGPRSRESALAYAREIEREADEEELRFIPVTTVDEAASRLIDLASA